MSRKHVTRYFPAGMTLRHNDLLMNEPCGKSTAHVTSGAKTNTHVAIKSPSPTKNVKNSDQKQIVSHTMKQKPPLNEEPQKFENEREISTDSGDIEASSLNTPVQTLSSRTMRDHTVRDQNKTVPPKTICRRRRSKSVNREKFNLNVNEYSAYNVDINNIKISDLNPENVLEDQKYKTADARDDGSCSNNNTEKHFKNKKDDFIEKLLQRSKSTVHLKDTAKRPKKEVIGTTTNVHSKLTEKQQCDCENCDNFINCVTWCDNNIKFDIDIKSCVESLVRKGLPLLKKSGTLEKPINIKKIYKNNILVHGAFIEKPVVSLKGTCFNENIKKALNNMNCSSAKPLQSYTWPLIQRRLNVIMVSPPQSGKTFSYLPAICTFAVEKSEKYLELSKYEGPLIIILCPDSEKSQQLKKLIDFIIEDSWEDMTVEVLNDPATKTNCDILVTMPTTLEEALKSERVTLKRLCHLVVEDTDLVLKNYHENIGKLLKILNEIQVNRPHKKNIQIIVSTEKWTIDIEHLMKKLYISPTIIFEDFLEAAVYSNINFIKKKVEFGT